jgi:hypothetical protein
LKIFNSLDCYVALKTDGGFLIAQSLGGQHNLASQPFARFETLLGDAVETLAAEILRRTLDGFSCFLPV